MKAVIFQHMSSNGPGTLQDILMAQNFDCQVVRTAYEDISSFKALDPDMLIVMGGSPGVYQADDYDFLKHEQRILEQRLSADRPTIGICLGAQLMAAALGAKVYKGAPGPEIGWFDLQLTADGQSSPIKVYKDIPVMQWHGDTFDKPSGTTLLGSSAKYPHQIFQYGHNCLGFQPHIEVTSSILADWYVQDAGLYVDHRDRLETLRRDTAQHIGPMTKATQAFMKEWLAQILSQQEKKHA